MAKIGLYFGSFNPVHIGHIAIAGYMTEFTDLDQVWFVVSPHNPLKNKETLLPDYQRLHIVRLGIEDRENLRASDIEFRLPVPSFTIDTLAYLNEKHPGNEFSVVMGLDNLYTLHKWKNADELISKYKLYVYPRPFVRKPSSTVLDRILSAAKVIKVDAPLMEISSTFIRSGIKAGKDMSYYVPAAAWKYLKEMHFYEK
ncbi:MAG TPA: nicotinate (nicotinamide) nucleotide adenylyltransferase [Bacteroidales bacterium]|nr:nicotinate (nicotinamide) nucleotide adenylyltransferase [Bacteroidales bacterium]